MKLSKPQRRYLEAIARCDWKQRNKDSSPAMRKWARENELIIQGRHAGDLPQSLTQKAKDILSNVWDDRQLPDSLAQPRNQTPTG